jgi:hypothetical protein
MGSMNIPEIICVDSFSDAAGILVDGSWNGGG